MVTERDCPFASAVQLSWVGNAKGVGGGVRFATFTTQVPVGAAAMAEYGVGKAIGVAVGPANVVQVKAVGYGAWVKGGICVGQSVAGICVGKAMGVAVGIAVASGIWVFCGTAVGNTIGVLVGPASVVQVKAVYCGATVGKTIGVLVGPGVGQTMDVAVGRAVAQGSAVN